MARVVRYMQNGGEVAPALFISQQKYSNYPRLETIHEEGFEDTVIVPKRVLYLLPLALSMALYFFLYKDVARYQ